MTMVAPLTLLSAVVQMDSSSSGWTLQDGEGDRRYESPVVFERAYSAPPVVHIGIVGMDSSKDHNLRVRARAESISAEGFTIVVETWLHTQVWAVDISWLAIGS